MKRRDKIQRRILHYVPVTSSNLSAYDMLEVISMNSCELVTYISSVACLISQACSREEVAVLATAFAQLGDTLSTILAHDELCDTKELK